MLGMGRFHFFEKRLFRFEKDKEKTKSFKNIVFENCHFKKQRFFVFKNGSF